MDFRSIASKVRISQLKSSARRPPEDYVVSNIRVADLESLAVQLFARPDPSEEPIPGHYVASDFNYDSYRSNREWWVKIQRDLCRLAMPADDEE